MFPQISCIFFPPGPGSHQLVRHIFGQWLVPALWSQ